MEMAGAKKGGFVFGKKMAQAARLGFFRKRVGDIPEKEPWEMEEVFLLWGGGVFCPFLKKGRC